MIATEECDFERSFTRLEEILDQMNAGTPSLDESLKLYEEADTLITRCAHKLHAAEARIEVLVKKRDGALLLDSRGVPQKDLFEGQEVAL